MTDTTLERETLTWDGFGVATRELARSILASGFEPEAVVAIARGGLLRGCMLALAVHLRKKKGADVQSATIYTKTSTIIQPDYAWKDTDLWINFPWSFQGTVREEDLGLRPSA